MARAKRHARPGGRCAAEARELVVVRETDSEIASRAAQPCLLGAEVVVVERGDDFLEADGIGAAVVHEAGGRCVRQIVLGDEVEAPNANGVHVERARAEVEHPLHHERGGRTGNAAIRSRGHGVRRHRADLAAVVLEAVRAGQQSAHHERLDARRPRHDRVRAGVAQHVGVDRPQPTVGVEAGAHRVVVIARMRAGDEVLAPCLHPLHRPPEPHREQAQRDVLRIHDALHAEAAAHVGRDDAQLVLGQAERLRQRVTCEMRHLRARPEGQLPLGGVPVGDAAASLHRRRGLTVRSKRSLDDDNGAVHGEIDTTVLEAARHEDIARRLLVHGRRGLAHGRLDIDRGGQRLVVDIDEHGAVLGRVAVEGDDGRERLADVTRARPREHRLRRRHVAGRRGSRDEAMPLKRLVGARCDMDDAGGCRCAFRVDSAKAGVRMDAAHEGDVQHARQLEVADVASTPGDQPRVLMPRLACAERRSGHGMLAQSIA